MKVEGSVVVITGGGSGLGLAASLEALEKGAYVSIFDLSDKHCSEFIKSKSERVLFCPVDITNEDSVSDAFAATVKKFGRVDVLINCAGISSPAKVLTREKRPLPLEKFSKVIDVNLTGSFNVIRFFVHQISQQSPTKGEQEEDTGLGEGGVIINVASVAAYEGQIGQTAYAASKGGVVSMTLPLARELATYGIRVNTIAPGVFLTPMLKGLSQKVQESLVNQIAFPKRLGDPSELAHAIFFLVENTYTNGTVIRVDGGIRMAAM